VRLLTWRAVARILIVGGGCRGLRLAAALHDDGHAVRVTTRSEAGRAAIEHTGAECWVGTPDRLETLRGALDRVAVACWLLATASGTQAQLRELNGPRLELFLMQAIDTTVRGFVYEGRTAQSPAATAELLTGGERIARRLTAQNRIPATFLSTDPSETAGWLEAARAAVGSFL
jgi:hypothetical protein